MARSERGTTFVAWTASLALASLSLILGGCGGTQDLDPTLEEAHTPPTGTLIDTKATLKGGAAYTNLATADNRARGTGQALIVGVAVIQSGSPQLRLLIDGSPVPSATKVFRGGGGAVATVSASRELPIGDSEVALEGRSGGKSVIGSRSLTVFTPAAADNLSSGGLVSAAAVNEQRVRVTPDGSGIGSTALTEDVNQVLLLASYRSPDESSSAPEAIRTEALLNGKALDEVADATMPEGKLAVYYSGDGASAGDQIDLVGFTVAGDASVHATSVAVCPCGLD